MKKNPESSRAIIEPRKRRGQEDIPPIAVMPCIRLDMDLFQRKLTRIKKVQDVWEGKIVRGQTPGGVDISLTGPVVAAPHGVILLEQLIALGARYLFFLGWCGSISRSVVIGDLIVPLAAVSEEGTSRHYPLPGKRIVPSILLAGRLSDALLKQDTPFHRGKIWTTDAPYRETEDKVIAYGRDGVLAVEMEMSALFKVALYREVDLAGLLVVSDELSSLSWKRGFDRPEFREARMAAVEAVLHACETVAGATAG
jgi:uridine phosphorylase